MNQGTAAYVVAGESAELREGLKCARAQIQQMHADLQAWEEAVSARDTELRNLQVHHSCSAYITYSYSASPTMTS